MLKIIINSFNTSSQMDAFYMHFLINYYYTFLKPSVNRNEFQPHKIQIIKHSIKALMNLMCTVVFEFLHTSGNGNNKSGMAGHLQFFVSYTKKNTPLR